MMLKFVLRNFRKRISLNLIKTLGLSLALCSFLLILLFVRYETTFDKYHPRSEDIYRFTTTDPDFLGGKHFARLYNPSFIPDMVQTIPGIENYVRLSPMRGGVMKYENRFYTINQAFQCDSTFFEVFNAELLEGNRALVLDAPGSMVISESFAKKVFKDDDPVGKLLILPSGQYYGEDSQFEIKGVMRDFPGNSHFHPDLITTPVHDYALESWAWTYLLLDPNTIPDSICRKFPAFAMKHFDVGEDDFDVTAHMENINSIHLFSKKTREIETNSNIAIVYSFTIAALLLLFIALINYTNLGFGMSGYSDRYRFVSKVFGASPLKQLQYFFVESIVISLLTLIISFFLVYFSLVYIHRWFALDMAAGNAWFIATIVAFYLVITFIAGLLPIFKDLKVTRQISSLGERQRKYRVTGVNKGLVLLQNVISIGLIVAVFVINKQTSYAIDKGMGHEGNSIVCINTHASIQSKFPELKNELLKYSSIEAVSGMMEEPGGESNDMFRFTMEGYVADENEEGSDVIGIFPCDYSFATLFDLTFLAGENFSEVYEDNEGSGEYIINESAMRRLNYSDPQEIIGKNFDLTFDFGDIEIPSGKIIGVVEDFHLSSLRRQIDPQVYFKRKDLWLLNFVVSFPVEKQEEALKDLETVWKELYPAYPLEYDFVDTMYENVYSTELLQVKLLSVFTLIALFICSMGLLGLSLLNTHMRIKEIGIRKVNGADNNDILLMLNWDFLKWILLAILFAVPLAWFAMSKWMQSFVYQTNIPWWIFGLAGFVALFVAFITISLQSYRSSSRNPVEALRYE